MAAQISVGVDLGSSAIKVVKLERQQANGSIHLSIAASIPVPLGATLSEAAAERETIAVRLKKIFSDMHIGNTQVTIALPEAQVFTRVIEVPVLSESELESALRWQADQYIPLPLSETTMDFAILTKPKDDKGKMQVLLVAAPLTVIDRTISLLSKAELEPAAIETEVIAGIRAFTFKELRSQVVMIVDSGATTTNFSIVSSGILLFTHSTALAGEAINRTISSAFNFEHAQAEEYKKVYGLDPQHFQGKVFSAIKPIVDSIVEEIRKSMIFFQDKNSNQSIKSIILTGGTALLPGLVPYIANALAIEVQIGNPWSPPIVADTTSVLTVPPRDMPIFGVATGLALRSLLDTNSETKG